MKHVLAVLITVMVASASNAEPLSSIRNTCSKENGGTIHTTAKGGKYYWTYNKAAYKECINRHALADRRQMGFKD